MITREITYTLAGGQAPYNLVITASNSCASVDYESPVSNSFLVTVVASSEDCFPVTLSFTGTDSQGCLITLPDEVVEGPCDDLVATPITIVNNGSDDILFRATASSTNCPNLTFSWVFNNLLFEQVGVSSDSYTSTLQLRTVESATFPPNTIISVNITDCNGCIKSESYNYTFCIPSADDFALSLFCVDNMYVSPDFLFPPLRAACRFIENPRARNIILPNGWTIEEGVTGPSVITAPITTLPGTYIGFWTSETTDGSVSEQGTITFTVIACDEGNTIFISSQDYFLDCALTAGSIIEIPAESVVTTSESTTVDWSTWEVVTPPTPVSPSITLGFSTSGQRVMYYEVPNPIVSDAFAWTVCANDGNCADAGVVTTIDCVNPPITGEDEACVSCADSVTIDVLDNDLGNGSPLVPSSLTITTPPLNGTATVSGGQIIYTPINTFSGQDELYYTVRNAQGATSAPTFVEIQVACAGDGGSIIICS